jgi:hypothetical protein
MKKTFTLTHPKLARPRVVEAIKHEVSKYVKRERRRELPEGVQFWDFDCKYGPTADEAETVHVADLNKAIDKAETAQLESFYLEILAKSGHRTRKPRPADTKPEPTPEPIPADTEPETTPEPEPTDEEHNQPE